MASVQNLSGTYSRRVFLRRASALLGIGVAGGALLAACGDASATSARQITATPTPLPSSPPATAAPKPPAARPPTMGGVDVGPSSDFANLSEPKAITINNKPAFITLINGKVSVLSALCTHQGCVVAWDNVDSEYKCPCHGSIYDASGMNIDGPAPRPLALLPSKIENGRLIVTVRS